MKRLLPLLFLLCVAYPLKAGSLITATVTVTNTPADGDTIQINGDTRTWKTSVATPASQITIGASIGANATNMFNQFAGNPFTTLSLNRSGTNGVTLRGIVDQTITISISGTWGSYSLSTNTTTESDIVRAPASSYPVQSKATNILSQVATDLQTYGTNAWSETAPILSNYVSRTQEQTLGNKTLTNIVLLKFIGNSGGVFTTNGIFASNESGSGTNTGYYIGFDGFGWPIVVDSGGNTVSAEPDSLGGILTLAYAKAFLPLLEDNGGSSTNTWNTAQSFIDPVFAASAQITNATIQAGTIAGNLSNVVQYSTGPAMQTVSSLANGNNAGVATTGYRFIKLTAGPTGAFTINGMAGGGIRELDIYNNTGQNMTIAHQSGTDPVSTNRIVSLTGADQSTTGDGWAHFVYDTTAARWVLTYLSP